MMESLPRWVLGALSMGVMCCARADAYRAIEQAVVASNAAIADAQAKLKDACSLADYAAAMTVLNGTNVWTVALQKALREHEIVRIPAAPEPYYIDATVVIPSNRRIEAEGATVALVQGTVILDVAADVGPRPVKCFDVARVPAGASTQGDCNCSQCHQASLFHFIPQKLR